MNLTSVSQVRSLLGELGVKPRKSLGQNFLIDKNILNILLTSADLSKADSVLEIGPGLGVVTEELLRTASRVVAVEKDRVLYSHLQGKFGEDAGLELLCDDAMKVDVAQLGINKVVSNLPYSVGSRFLMETSRMDVPPEVMVVTVQQEVAKRMCAVPGTRDYGLLSVWLQLVYDVSLKKVVKPTCFWPRPDVTSAIVVMRAHGQKMVSPAGRDMLYPLTKHVFAYRRKQLVTIMRNAPSGLMVEGKDAEELFEEAGVDGKMRPGDLSVKDWCGLSEGLLCTDGA
jgi:16S rRNA (adenine1518-N6/adenine1519-N6)-dimethyltransferase